MYIAGLFWIWSLTITNSQLVLMRFISDRMSSSLYMIIIPRSVRFLGFLADLYPSGSTSLSSMLSSISVSLTRTRSGWCSSTKAWKAPRLAVLRILFALSTMTLSDVWWFLFVWVEFPGSVSLSSSKLSSEKKLSEKFGSQHFGHIQSKFVIVW